jgi:hypothetical protein
VLHADGRRKAVKGHQNLGLLMGHIAMSELGA